MARARTHLDGSTPVTATSNGEIVGILPAASAVVGLGDKRVLFQDGAAISGEAGFEYDKTTNTLDVGTAVSLGEGVVRTRATSDGSYAALAFTVPNSGGGDRYASLTLADAGVVSAQFTLGDDGTFEYYDGAVSYGILTTRDYATAGGVVVNRVNATNGAVQADDGGDARGTYAVDMQTFRSAATQVASGSGATISGGNNNTASSSYATASGGINNNASGYGSVVAGGEGNTASSNSPPVVSGGESNTASGDYSTVPGGINNTASGNYSFAAGRRAKATHAGSFVLADSQNADANSTATDQLFLRYANGVLINGNVVQHAGNLFNATHTWSELQTFKKDSNAGWITKFENTTDGTASNAGWRCTSDVADQVAVSHATSRTTARFGVTLGGWNEYLSFTGSGLAMGTFGAVPFILGTNATEAIHIDSSQVVKINKLKTATYTVATLPTGSAGMRAFVTDANATTFASVVAGGGANGVPCYHDGTNWRIG